MQDRCTRAGGSLIVSWSSRDPDGDSLAATVDYSADAGHTWSTVYDGPSTGRAVVPNAFLAGSPRARVRVFVNDGFNEAEVISGLFRAAAYPMLVVFPGAVVCTLAREVGIPTSIFLVVITVCAVAAVFLIRWLAGVFGPQVDAVLHFFDRFTLPATAATIVAVVLWILWERHRQPRANATADENPPS